MGLAGHTHVSVGVWCSDHVGVKSMHIIFMPKQPFMAIPTLLKKKKKVTMFIVFPIASHKNGP